jgi:exodeoxyribonuclease VII small subunit
VNKKTTTEIEDAPLQGMTFEQAFARLEQILERMNSGGVSLDESLKLYEEADLLIVFCSKRLNDAEKKIELLMKNRNGELVVGPDQKPQTQEIRFNSVGA